MKSGIDILILDEDRFFARGLYWYLHHYSYQTGKSFRFIKHLCEASGPVIAFFTLQTAKYLPSEVLLTPSSFVRPVCIAKQRILQGDTCPAFPWIPVLHRESAPNTLADIISREPKFFPSYRKAELTLQEVRTLKYLALGLQESMTGKLMNISEKTVSTHKRRAMHKLKLRNNHSLQLWLAGPGKLCIAP